MSWSPAATPAVGAAPVAGASVHYRSPASRRNFFPIFICVEGTEFEAVRMWRQWAPLCVGAFFFFFFFSCNWEGEWTSSAVHQPSTFRKLWARSSLGCILGFIVHFKLGRWSWESLGILPIKLMRFPQDALPVPGKTALNVDGTSYAFAYLTCLWAKLTYILATWSAQGEVWIKNFICILMVTFYLQLGLIWLLRNLDLCMGRKIAR